KEDDEKTIPWQIDRNHSLVTLCQFTYLDKTSQVSRNYLIGLGQRLGITSILVIVSIESFNTVYTLLDSLVQSMETNSHPLSQPSWWNRVILIINQQHGVSDQAAFMQRKHVLLEDMQHIQERYQLSQPLSTLFLSTHLYDQVKHQEQGAYYKVCCQRILWQMMARHTLCGRWCSETLQSRLNSTGKVALNILTEEDESDSSHDDDLFVTVIDYVDGKMKKPEKKKGSQQPIQRRATRRQIQKLHCYDGDDGTIPPVPMRPF
ncbi:hypothetical protein EDC96DRAFT_447919, partial [Choanephora cucurbitarum]